RADRGRRAGAVTSTATPGAGLLPARAARPIRAGERIHVIGAAGAGASAAVLHAAWAGADVDGCDPGGPSAYTSPITALDVPLVWEHAASHVTRTPPPERLAVTKALTAIAPDHPELAAARAAGIPIEPWQQVIADAASGRRLIGVAGTHGKSTTAGWLVHVLVDAGLDPSAFVGALLPPALTGGPAATARRGSGDAFVVEADEYAGNFEAYRPSIAIVTSAEWDHPDVFADRSAVVDAFVSWLRAAAATADGGSGQPLAIIGLQGGGELVADRLRGWPGRIVTTALVETSERSGAGDAVTGRVLALDPDGSTVEIDGLDAGGPRIARLATAGLHNVRNALGVAVAAREAGVPADVIVRALGTFRGVGRRLERLGDARGVVVYDDYGHHPTAIRMTLDAVRQREPGRRIWAVYEPLTYHRTAAMLDAFAEVLATADAVAIADIWAGRDPDTTITSAAALAEAVAGRRPDIPVAAPGTVEATAAWLAGEVRSGDAVLVMGGGKSTVIGRRLLEALADR
ncbi:MAG TPA: cyanophycin synthetase, partial [Candidatus Limnocylindrales bacterium]|nr:cyanophycin synthetase [Candidatus Limnocylindrales bacterium]